jgi:hypothetical protein
LISTDIFWKYLRLKLVMNDTPSGDNATATASARSVVDRIPARLNLSLQQALGCLDLKLEDELSRFRSRQDDLTEERQGKVDNVAAEAWQAETDSNSEIITGEIVRSALTQPNHADAAGEKQREPDLSQSGGFIIIDGIYPPKDDRLAITHVSDAPSSVNTDFADAQESLDVNFAPRGEITYEYSASSQELLRQIQSGYTTPGGTGKAIGQTAPSPAKKRKLFTPVKIGSLAVACLLAGGAAYTYFNPAILAPLTATNSSVPATTTGSSLGQTIQSPNLAANEFTELNLSTLNTVKLPTAAPAPSTATNPTSATPTTTDAPVAIPYNGMNATPVPPTTIVVQPRLADSLIRSLLPPNFHTTAKQSRYPAAQSGLRR